MKLNTILLLFLFLVSAKVANAQTSPTIAELEQQKNKAAEEENYKLASELKLKIQELKDKEKIELENARIAEEQRKKTEEENLLKEKIAAEQKKKAEEEALLKERLAEEQRKKAEVEEFKKEIEEATRRKKTEEDALLKEKMAADQKKKAEEQALLKEKLAAEQKQKLEEQAILKSKLDSELKEKAEQQQLEKEIAFAELQIKKDTDLKIKDLESQKLKAVASENYLLAEELQGKIKKTKEEEESRKLLIASELQIKKENAKAIEQLEKEKKAAALNQNYILANELQNKIKALKENKEISVSTPVSKPIVKTENNSNTAPSSAGKIAKKSEKEIQLENLEKEKAKAVADANYKLAGELKNKIESLKAEIANGANEAKKKAELDAQINDLEKQKAKAVADANYKLAGEINTKIKNLKNPNNTSVAKTNISNTQNKTGVSSSNNINSRTNSVSTLNQTKQTLPSSTANPVITNSSARISRSSESENTGIKYRRSSLYTLMVNNTSRERADVIKDAFIKSPLPEKFNDHNLTVSTIDVTSNSNATNLVNNLNSYFQTNNIAKELVAKWFNRNEKGCFNMDLIAQRGTYNASNIDLNLAKSSSRGLALLSDAGEELIGNTYVIINDFRFTNKEEVANKAKAGLGLLNAFSTLAGGPDLSAATTIASAGATIAGKGYTVRTNSYLFQLVWTPEIAATFYQDYWVDETNYDENKKQAFDNSNFFTLKYIGTESGLADLQSSIFTNKTEDQLIYKATSKAVDNGIAKLQRKFEQFRVKTPLYSVNPLAAKIGKKEGLEAGDRFEVLEQVLDENGKLNYVRKGIITVDGRNIWDNTNSIEELEEAGKNLNGANQFTIFSGNGDYQPGMLIRQIR